MKNDIKTKISVSLRNMTADDVAEVKSLERLCFSESWPEDSLLSEINNTKIACYLIACCGGRIVGYMGAWLIMDEVHVTTIGVDPQLRGYGIGKFLVWNLFRRAREKNSRWATLEVNAKNVAARELYESFGFKKIGERKSYYGPGEDAIVMWVGNLMEEEFTQRMEKIRKEWEEKLCLSLE